MTCRCGHDEDEHGRPVGDNFDDWGCSICHCPAFRPQMTPLPNYHHEPAD